jgi:hypothetical protein
MIYMSYNNRLARLPCTFAARLCDRMATSLGHRFGRGDMYEPRDLQRPRRSGPWHWFEGKNQAVRATFAKLRRGVAGRPRPKGLFSLTRNCAEGMVGPLGSELWRKTSFIFSPKHSNFQLTISDLVRGSRSQGQPAGGKRGGSSVLRANRRCRAGGSQ